MRGQSVFGRWSFGGALVALLVGIPVLSGCAQGGLRATSAPATGGQASGTELVGAVYVVTNKTDSNSVFGFGRRSDGTFSTLGEYATGGKGTGDLEVPGLSPRDDTHPLLDGQDPLISAYALEKTGDGRFVLVANPGDGTISSMRVNRDYSLTLVSTVGSGGPFPISIAEHDGVVFVANIGDSNFKGQIAGFTIDDAGVLSPLEGTVRKLGYLGGRPSCIRFTPNGEHVVVTQVLSGVIAVYAFDGETLSKRPVSTADSPQADRTRSLANPVGFDLIDKGDGSAIAVVSEARFFAPALQLLTRDGGFFFQTSSTSTYRIAADGEVTLISGDVLTGTAREGGQRANCWIGLSADGRYAYAVNALDGSISSYSVAPDGRLSLLKEIAYKTPEYSFLTDIYRSGDGKYLYQLHGYGGRVSVLEIGTDGQLVEATVLEGEVPPVGAFGILAV